MEPAPRFNTGPDQNTAAVWAALGARVMGNLLDSADRFKHGETPADNLAPLERVPEPEPGGGGDAEQQPTPRPKRLPIDIPIDFPHRRYDKKRANTKGQIRISLKTQSFP